MRPGQPYDRSLCPLRSAPVMSGDFALAPINVLRLDLGAIGVDAAKKDTATRDLAIVDEDKAAEDRVAILVIENQRPRVWIVTSATSLRAT